MSMALFIKVGFLLLLAAPPSLSKRLKMDAVPQGAIMEDSPPAALVQSNQHDKVTEVGGQTHSTNPDTEVVAGTVELAEEPKVGEKTGGGVVEGLRNTFQGFKQWLLNKFQKPEDATDKVVREAVHEIVKKGAEMASEETAATNDVPKTKPELSLAAKIDVPKIKPGPSLHASTVVCFVLLLVVQLYISNLCYDTSGWLLSPIVKYLSDRPTQYLNAVANMKPQVASLGIEATPALWVQFNVGVAMHHTAAFIFALLACRFRSPTLFRLGISFEIGEGLLQYIQMALTWSGSSIFPGFGPFATLPKVAWVFPILHHILGLVAGTFAFFYLSDWVEVQRLTALLFAVVLPGLMAKPLEVLADLNQPSVYGKINIVLQIIGMVFALYIRFFIYFPWAFSLHGRVYAEVGAASAGVLSVPLVLFGVFSVMSFLLSALPLISMRKAETFDEAVDCIRKSASALHSHTPYIYAHDACSDHHCVGLHSKFMAASKWAAKMTGRGGDEAAPTDAPVLADSYIKD